MSRRIRLRGRAGLRGRVGLRGRERAGRGRRSRVAVDRERLAGLEEGVRRLTAREGLVVEADICAAAPHEPDGTGALLADKRNIHERTGVEDEERIEDAVFAADHVPTRDAPVLGEKAAVRPFAHGRPLVQVERGGVLEDDPVAAVAGRGDAAHGRADQDGELGAGSERALGVRRADAAAGGQIHRNVVRTGVVGAGAEDDRTGEPGEQQEGGPEGEPPEAGSASRRGRRAAPPERSGGQPPATGAAKGHLPSGR